METISLNCINISQFYCFHCIFDHINADFASIRHDFKNHSDFKLLYVQ